jgi:hypothetical protein
VVTKKRLPIFYYQYDTEERDAGSTLAAAIRGPNHGVHLTGPEPVVLVDELRLPDMRGRGTGGLLSS